MTIPGSRIIIITEGSPTYRVHIQGMVGTEATTGNTALTTDGGENVTENATVDTGALGTGLGETVKKEVFAQEEEAAINTPPPALTGGRIVLTEKRIVLTEGPTKPTRERNGLTGKPKEKSTGSTGKPKEGSTALTEKWIVPTEKQIGLIEETEPDPALPEPKIDVTDDVIEKKIVLKKSVSVAPPGESEDQDSKRETRHPFKQITLQTLDSC